MENNIINFDEYDDYITLAKLIQANKNNPDALYRLLKRIFDISNQVSQFCTVYANCDPQFDFFEQIREKIKLNAESIADFARIDHICRDNDRELREFAFDHIKLLVSNFEQASSLYINAQKDGQLYVFAVDKLIEYTDNSSDLYTITRKNKTDDSTLIHKVDTRLLELGFDRKEYDSLKEYNYNRLGQKSLSEIIFQFHVSALKKDSFALILEKVNRKVNNFELLLQHVCENMQKHRPFLKNISRNLALLVKDDLDNLLKIYDYLPHTSSFTQPITSYFSKENIDFDTMYERIFMKTKSAYQIRLVSKMIELATTSEQVHLMYVRTDYRPDLRELCLQRHHEIAQDFDSLYFAYRYEADTDRIMVLFRKMLDVAKHMEELCFLYCTTKKYPILYQESAHRIIKLITGISSMCFVYRHVPKDSPLFVAIEEMIIANIKTPRDAHKVCKKIPDNTSLYKRAQELSGKLMLTYIEKQNQPAPEDEIDENLYRLLSRYEPSNYGLFKSLLIITNLRIGGFFSSSNCISQSKNYHRSMKDKTLLVLAAGMGSRYGGLKQLDGFGPHNETLLEYSVFDAIKAGFTQVVFVIREEFFDQFYQKFHAIFANQIKVDYVFQQVKLEISGFNFPERTKPWGTGQAILCAQHVIDNPFCVINADDYYGQDGYSMMARYLDNITELEFGMVAYVLKNTLSNSGGVNRGICTVSDLGLLTNINEHLALRQSGDIVVDENGEEFDLDTTVSMNFWGFHQSFFEHIQHHRNQFIQSHRDNPKSEFYIPSVCDSCIKNYHMACRVMISHDQRAGVTYPEDKPIVQEVISEFVENGKYPDCLWQ